MTIMWMSRHNPTQRQLAELERLFPGHNLEVDINPFTGADDIALRVRRTLKASDRVELVVVAPLTVVRELVKRGLRPLQAVMEQIPCDDPAVEVRIGHWAKRDRCYKFLGFRRITNVRVETEPIFPITT